MLRVLLISICFLSSVVSHGVAQTDNPALLKCREEVREINSLTFTRVFLYGPSVGVSDEGEIEWAWAFSNYNGFDNQAIKVYIDDQNRIRKFIETDWCEEYGRLRIYYYDDSGKLCYGIIRNSFVTPDLTIGGYFYSVGDSLIQAEVRRAEIIYHPDGPSEEIVNYKTYGDGLVSERLKEFGVPATTDDLLKQFSLSEVTVPADCPQVRFMNSVKNLSYVSRNDVNVRQGPNTSYPVVRKMHIGYEAFLLEEYDPYDWFKIGEGEYIHGAYLEPTEFILK